MKEEPIHVLDKRVQLLQAPGGFRTSLDSVLLAAACKASKNDHVLDLGCGVGSAGLCVLARVPGVKLTGIDIQEDHIELAKQNAVLNKAVDQCNFIRGDIKNLKGENFDHVICNPPFLEAGSYTASPSSPRAKALGHENEETSLKDWLDAGFRSLKNNGSFIVIHRADQGDKILRELAGRFGAIEVIPFWPRAGEPAKRVIIRGLKNRKSPATFHAGIVLHEPNGNYTVQADAVLRDMQAI